MAIYNKETMKSPDTIKIVTDGKLQNVLSVYKYHRNKVQTLWELVEGFIYTSDGYSLITNDSYILKCSDQ